MKELIERIYRNCFAPQTLINLGVHNTWEAGYRAIGKALKKILDEKNDL